MKEAMQYPWSKPFFISKEKKYLMNAFTSTWISGGPYVKAFEERFAKQLRVPYVIPVSNGTTALYVAMVALGIGPGDEVIVPGFTFVAALNMVIALGAKPVCVDVDLKTWCIDPYAVKAAITAKTKAICVVHLYGNACEMTQINHIAQEYKLAVIEDAAQATFSSYKGRFLGTWGNIGTFSFHVTKTLAMGEGGCVVTAYKKHSQSLHTLINHGMKSRGQYWHDAIGFNFRLSNLHAAIGVAQLEKADQLIKAKKRVYRLYHERLSSIKGIIFQEPTDGKGVLFWAAAFRIDAKAVKAKRESIAKALFQQGIETRPGFVPVNQLPIYKKYVMTAMPNARLLGREVMSLPSYGQLSDKDIHIICDTLTRLIKKA